ncbi:MAG: zinc metalloprotease HtpX [Thermoprotei archaeon]|nr:MAG: zinc metalloprotease HtpX [Thermoprotei archaeon]
MVSLVKLRLGMLGSIALIIGLGSLVLMAILTYLFGGFGMDIMITALIIVVMFNLLQWLFAPHIIDAMYRVRPADIYREGWLIDTVKRIAKVSGLKKVPKVMVAEINVPNAFAYGSPLTGPRVAVTRRAIEVLNRDELEAVIAHEIGHIKHKDMAVMMLISIIPAIMYWLGIMLMRYGMFSAAFRSRDRGAEGGLVLVLGGLALAALSFIFNLFVLWFSRMREYYADTHAAFSVNNGALKLQRALAKILIDTGFLKRRGVRIEKYETLKALFIADPGHRVIARGYINIDRVIAEIKSMKVSIWNELFSTHPHPAKRFRFLDKLIGI